MPLDDAMDYNQPAALGPFQPQPHPHPRQLHLQLQPNNTPFNRNISIVGSPLPVYFEQLQRAVPIAPRPHPVAFLPHPVASPPHLHSYSTTNSMPSTPVLLNPATDTNNLHQQQQQHYNHNIGNAIATPSVQPLQPQTHTLKQSPIASIPSTNTLSITPNSNPSTPRAPLPALPQKSTRTESIQARERKRVTQERIKKGLATRKRNRAAKQLHLDEEACQMRKLSQQQNASQQGRVGAMESGDFKVGDKVICRPSKTLGQEAAQVVLVNGEQLYVHFEGRDRRMDRWISRNEVTAARQNTHNIDAYTAPNLSPQVKLTRSKSRQLQERNPVSEKETGNEAVARAEKEREEKTKVKNVAKLVFGCYELDAWYYSPFPIAQPSASEPNSINNNVDCMYMCQYCMIYGKSLSRYWKHKQKCAWTKPPGYRIYHDTSNQVSVYEIDGMVNVGYCQRLTLLGKLFLDHKTLFFDVSPFLFYVVTIGGEVGGFFSKEKPERKSEYNLACILTLPHHQKKGLGRFLIEFSYILSRREGKIGSPERPLSDLGQVSYRSFWVHEILKYAREAKKKAQIEVPVDVVAEETGIRVQDVIQVLKTVKMLKIWKGDQSMNLSNSSSIEKQWRASKKGKIPIRNSCLVAAPGGRKKQSASAKKKQKTNGMALGTIIDNRNYNHFHHHNDLQLHPSIHKRGSSSTDAPSQVGKKRGRPPKSRDSLSPSNSGRGTRQRLGTRTPNAIPYADIPMYNTDGYGYGNNANSSRRFHSSSPSTPLSSAPATPRAQHRKESDFMDQAFKGALLSFCSTHTPEKVLLPHDHPDGIPKSAIVAFSKQVNKPPGMVEKRLRAKAGDIIVQRHVKPKPKSPSPGFYNNNNNHHNHNRSHHNNINRTPPIAVKRPGAKDVRFVARALNTSPNNGGEFAESESVMPPSINAAMTSLGSPRKSPLRNNNINIFGNCHGAKETHIATDGEQATPPRRRISGIICKNVNGSPKTPPAAPRPDAKDEPRRLNSPMGDTNKKNVEVIDLISDGEGDAADVHNGDSNILSTEKVSSSSKSTTHLGSTSSSPTGRMDGGTEQAAVYEAVGHDREVAIEAAIMKVMKQRKLLSSRMLELEVIRMPNAVFTPEQKQIRERIEDLITRKSIAREDGSNDMYKYIP